MRQLTNNTPPAFTLDTRLFHQELFFHLRQNAVYAYDILKEDDIVDLVDPVLSFLFAQRKNFKVRPNGEYDTIFNYYSRNDFYELFDNLMLDFDNFLYFQGISRYQNYTVLRVDNFLTVFIDEGSIYGKNV